MKYHLTAVMLQASILHSGKLLGFLPWELSREALSFESFVERHAENAGHFPQVRVQVTMLQIIKQHQKCLLALISLQNGLLDRGETVKLTDL